MLSRPCVPRRIKIYTQVPPWSRHLRNTKDMQNCNDGEELRGADNSTRTEQASTNLRDMTWDDSYGIVFGSPAPTQDVPSTQLRTFKRSPSSTSRFFSTSSTVSLPVPPLRRSRISKQLGDDGDPYADLGPKPLQNRPQVRIPNAGEAPRTLQPSQVQRLKEIENQRLAEAQRLEDEREDERRKRELEAQKRADEQRRRDLEDQKLRKQRVELMAENNVKDMRQKVEASGDSITETAILIDMATLPRRVADAQEIINESAQLTTAYFEEYKAIDSSIRAIDARLRFFEKVDSWEKLIDESSEVYGNLKDKLFARADALEFKLGDDVSSICASSLLPNEQKEELYAKWMCLKVGFKTIVNTAHAYRKFWRLRVEGELLKQENACLEAHNMIIWLTYRREVYTDYDSFFKAFQESLTSKPYFRYGLLHPDIRELTRQCRIALREFAGEYSKFMDVVETHWTACQSPIFRQQKRELELFRTYLSSLGLSRRILTDLASYSKAYKELGRVHELDRLEIISDYQKLTLLYLKRLHLQRHNDEDTGDQKLSLSEHIQKPQQRAHQRSQGKGDILKGLEEKLKALPESKAWIANPIVWEMLAWDIEILTQQELQIRSTPRLIRVLQREEILSSPAMKNFLASPAIISKAHLLQICSKLVDFSRRAQEDGVKSIVWNKDLVLLRAFKTSLEELNQVPDTYKEQTLVSWIPNEAKEMESWSWKKLNRMRVKNLRLWGVLLDVWLNTQGLDLLSPYYHEETKNILLWKKSLKSEMVLPEPASLDVDETSNLEEHAEDVIGDDEFASFEDIAMEPGNHDVPVPVTPPGSLAYRRDPEANAPYWDYTLYIGPKNVRVKVHYCASRKSTERIILKYFMREKVIGFDMEWKANSSSSDPVRDKVSLVQVASEQRIGLFHIARYEKGDVEDELVAPSLRTLMESSKVIKTGVNIKADCTRLWNNLGIESNGLFELSHLYKLVKYAQLDPTLINKRPVKMAVQVEEHLGLPLWKGDVRTSNWAGKLGNEQIHYAASDPYACVHLFDVLECKRKAMVPIPPRPEFAELNKPILLANGQSIGAFRKTTATKQIIGLEEPEEVEEAGEIEEIEQDSDWSALDSGTVQRLETTIIDEDQILRVPLGSSRGTRATTAGSVPSTKARPANIPEAVYSIPRKPKVPSERNTMRKRFNITKRGKLAADFKMSTREDSDTGSLSVPLGEDSNARSPNVSGEENFVAWSPDISSGDESIAESPRSPREDDSVAWSPNVPDKDDFKWGQPRGKTKPNPRTRSQDNLSLPRAPPRSREPVSAPTSRRKSSIRAAPVLAKTYRFLSESSDPDETDKESKPMPTARRMESRRAAQKVESSRALGRVASEKRSSERSIIESTFPNPGYPDLTAAMARPVKPKGRGRSRSESKERTASEDPNLTPPKKTRSVTKSSDRGRLRLHLGKPPLFKRRNPSSEEAPPEPFLSPPSSPN